VTFVNTGAGELVAKAVIGRDASHRRQAVMKEHGAQVIEDEFEIDLQVATVRSLHRSNSRFRSETLLLLTNCSNLGQELVSRGLGLDALGEIGVDLSARGRRRAGSRRCERGHADGERNRLLEHRVVERPGRVERERILLK
jgi:hypothetical protein